MNFKGDDLHPTDGPLIEETFAQCEPSMPSLQSQPFIHHSTGSLEDKLYSDVIPQQTITPDHSPNLLNLPIEIRVCIYDYVFDTTIKDVSVQGLDQRLGNGLSLACSQLYGETRTRYYNCARYRFASPGECQSFLETVGPISYHIGSLLLYLRDDIFDIAVFKYVFNTLIQVSELHTLELKIRPSGLSLSSLSFPMYFPAARLSDPATYYDMCLRPTNHPLAQMRSIRNLKVSGYAQSCELEEAILKLSVNMEQTARREMKKTTSYPFRRPFGSGASWFYSMKIEED